MITLKQIANKCEVSIATVSKVINGEPGISEETRERILKTSREAGYLPNAAARALKTRHSHNIGVVIKIGERQGMGHEFFANILSNLRSEAENRGYDITMLSKRLEGLAMGYLEHCRYRNCDGVVIISMDDRDADTRELIESDIPAVSIDYVYPRKCAVLSDNESDMRDLVRFVYDKGHRRIAFIHGETTSVTKARVKSFKRTCEELSVLVPDEYVRAAIFHDLNESASATNALLALPDPPTCIFYPDDYAAMGGLNALEAMGKRVPEDVSIVGYDGISMTQMLHPRLTTIRQSSEQIGIEAARMLCEAIENPQTFLPRRVILPGKLLEGETVADIRRQ